MISKELRRLLERIANNADSTPFIGVEQRLLRQMLDSDTPWTTDDSSDSVRRTEIGDRWLIYERLRFEKWAKDQGHLTVDLTTWKASSKEAWGRYLDPATQQHWLTWRGCARRYIEDDI